MEKILSDLHADQILSSVIYSFLGTIIFVFAYALIAKLAPFSVKKEISEDHNVALGIMIGSVIIGLSIIISAAIR